MAPFAGQMLGPVATTHTPIIANTPENTSNKEPLRLDNEIANSHGEKDVRMGATPSRSSKSPPLIPLQWNGESSQQQQQQQQLLSSEMDVDVDMDMDDNTRPSTSSTRSFTISVPPPPRPVVRLLLDCVEIPVVEVNPEEEFYINPAEFEVQSFSRITAPAGRVVYKIIFRDGHTAEIPAAKIYDHVSEDELERLENGYFRDDTNPETIYDNDPQYPGGGPSGGTLALESGYIPGRRRPMGRPRLEPGQRSQRARLRLMGAPIRKRGRPRVRVMRSMTDIDTPVEDLSSTDMEGHEDEAESSSAEDDLAILHLSRKLQTIPGSDEESDEVSEEDEAMISHAVTNISIDESDGDDVIDVDKEDLPSRGHIQQQLRPYFSPKRKTPPSPEERPRRSTPPPPSVVLPSPKKTLPLPRPKHILSKINSAVQIPITSMFKKQSTGWTNTMNKDNSLKSAPRGTLEEKSATNTSAATIKTSTPNMDSFIKSSMGTSSASKPNMERLLKTTAGGERKSGPANKITDSKLYKSSSRTEDTDMEDADVKKKGRGSRKTISQSGTGSSPPTNDSSYFTARVNTPNKTTQDSSPLPLSTLVQSPRGFIPINTSAFPANTSPAPAGPATKLPSGVAVISSITSPGLSQGALATLFKKHSRYQSPSPPASSPIKGPRLKLTQTDSNPKRIKPRSMQKPRLINTTSSASPTASTTSSKASSKSPKPPKSPTASKPSSSKPISATITTTTSSSSKLKNKSKLKSKSISRSPHPQDDSDQHMHDAPAGDSIMDDADNYLADEEYIVEKILTYVRRNGEKFYLVKWEGYPEEQSTWEPVENLKGSLDLVEEFERTRLRGG